MMSMFKPVKCPPDCRHAMRLTTGEGKSIINHCGYILGEGNGSRGCDPGPACKRYEPEKKKEPVTVQIKKKRPEWDKEKARQMWLDGKTDREIAEAVGVHPETIRKIRRRKWMNEEMVQNAAD